MRPSPRFFGALALGGILYLAGGDYEVPWLQLIAMLLWALIPAAWVYALLNARRVEGGVEIAAAEASADHVFEGDRPLLLMRLRSRRGEWGPARILGADGGTRFAAARLTPRGVTSEVALPEPVRRGPIEVAGLRLEIADPLGIFRTRRPFGPASALALPRYRDLGRLAAGAEHEAELTAARVGVGEEVVGVREYRHGDPLRRMHWRSSARRGELVVREYEPPAAPALLVLCPRRPADRDEADEIARTAASEVWTTLRSGGRAYLAAPGLPVTRSDEAANLWSLLEWLALYPGVPGEDGGLLPTAGEAVAAGPVDAELGELLDRLRRRGVRVRG